ncbi:hypothetical protein QBC32DRAFT_64642 [Pseudoneurospora amorphoporcata]|uniref:Uncharacterized protein n=1 Tax=Pseudoneurospora amorphoporcata TaxID=241081 RepID=A0AAN6SHW6_9PEZI|nr:hypothetical protein QBC32DRAFT_64642 [Pseudoneurospora amorphoporcata]
MLFLKKTKRKRWVHRMVGLTVSLSAGWGYHWKETINSEKGSRGCILCKVSSILLSFRLTKKGGQLVRVGCRD